MKKIQWFISAVSFKTLSIMSRWNNTKQKAVRKQTEINELKLYCILFVCQKNMHVYPKNSITTHVQKINVTHGPRAKETVKYSMNSVQTKHYKFAATAESLTGAFQNYWQWVWMRSDLSRGLWRDRNRRIKSSWIKGSRVPSGCTAQKYQRRAGCDD